MLKFDLHSGYYSNINQLILPRYKLSDYITSYSNRPYAYDQASGHKFNRDDPNFDIIDAVINLGSKSLIKNENYIKLIFYGNNFTLENSKCYFETKIQNMVIDIGHPWNIVDDEAYIKHDFRMSSLSQAQRKLDENYNKQIYNYKKK